MNLIIKESEAGALAAASEESLTISNTLVKEHDL